MVSVERNAPDICILCHFHLFSTSASASASHCCLAALAHLKTSVMWDGSDLTKHQTTDLERTKLGNESFLVIRNNAFCRADKC